MICGLPVATGWPVRMPRALIFRTPTGEVSPSRNSWWAMRADLVVERLEDQGVAGGFEVGGAEEVGGVGVGEGDVPAGPGVVLPVFVVLGVVGGDGVGDERSTITGPQEPRSASCSSTQIAAAFERRWVWRATRRACQAGTSSRDTRFQSIGRRWRRSRASAISCAPADGDMPSARANGSGVNAATSGVPSPPSDSSARGRRPPGVSTPVSAVAGCRSAQWAASWSLRNAARRSACSASAAASSTPAGSRSPTSYSSRTVVLMGQAKHRPPTLEASEPLVHKGIRRS